MESVKILGAFDITADVENVSKEDQSVDNVFGQLARKRTFTVNDPRGAYNPFFSKSIFAGGGWRGQKLEHFDSNGQVAFSGTIQKITAVDKGFIKQVVIEAMEPLATILEFPVEAFTVLPGFTVSGSHTKGATTINVGNLNGLSIPTPAYVSFAGNVSPRYQIIKTTGSPVSSIQLDRGLEADLTSGWIADVSIPSVETFAQTIRAAIFAADRGNLITFGPSFDTLHAEDTAANRKVWCQVKLEDGVKLKDHLTTLLTMSDFKLYPSTEGLLEIRRGVAFSGVVSPEKITTAEILKIATPEYDMSKLYYGYDLFSINGDNVERSQATITDAEFRAWANAEWFRPIRGENTVLAHKYLYNSTATAAYFGGRILDYYKVPRTNFVFDMKAFYHQKPLHKIKLSTWKDFALNIPVMSDLLENEPVTVLSFRLDERTSKYTGVNVQLTSRTLTGET